MSKIDFLIPLQNLWRFSLFKILGSLNMFELEKSCLVNRNKTKQWQNFETWINVNKWLKEKIGFNMFQMEELESLDSS
jgi:hypothetical protein